MLFLFRTLGKKQETYANVLHVILCHACIFSISRDTAVHGSSATALESLPLFLCHMQAVSKV